MKERKNLKEYFKTKYTDEEIENHYNYIKLINIKNKEKYNQIIIEHSEDISKIKRHFKKVKPSLKGDGVWCNNLYGRIFIYFNDIDNAIKFYSGKEN